jgi:hypothetical protein
MGGRENKRPKLAQRLPKDNLHMNPITSEKNKLGFIGIGYMGLPIAHRLLESGFKLTA